MMEDDKECKETYKECMASHKARYQKVIDERQPWETIKDLAEKAGCGHATIERLLQFSSPEGVCNEKGKKAFETQVELTIYELKKIHQVKRRETILKWISENWNVTIIERSEGNEEQSKG